MALSDTIASLGTSIINLVNTKVASYVPPTATTSKLGVIKPDGTTITINNGVISSAGSFPSQTGHAGDILTTDGTNVSWADTASIMPVIQFYKDGTDWYKVYAPDATGYCWCEQGGWIERTATGILPVALLKSFVDLSYSVQSTLQGAASYATSSTFYTPYVVQKSTTGFSLSTTAAIANIDTFIWQACGYINNSV